MLLRNVCCSLSRNSEGWHRNHTLGKVAHIQHVAELLEHVSVCVCCYYITIMRRNCALEIKDSKKRARFLSPSLSLILSFDLACSPLRLSSQHKSHFSKGFPYIAIANNHIVLSRRQKLCNKSLFWSDSKPKWCFFTPCSEPFYQPEVIIVVHFLCDFVFPIASVYREKESEPATTIYLLGSLWASYWASDGLRSTMDWVIERYGNSFSTRCGWIVWVFRAIENLPLEAVEF